MEITKELIASMFGKVGEDAYSMRDTIHEETESLYLVGINSEKPRIINMKAYNHVMLIKYFQDWRSPTAQEIILFELEHYPIKYLDYYLGIRDEEAFKIQED